MRFEFGFYSSLLLIFFVHGLVYAGLLIHRARRNQSSSDAWLAAFLVLCSLYIAPWMLGFAGWYDNQPYRDILFYTPLQHLLFIGPVLFFYVQSLLNPSFTFTRKEFLHLLPGVGYVLYSLVMFATDKLVLKEYFFLSDGADRDFDLWYQLLGFISMFLYFLLSLRYYSLYKKFMVQVVSYADVVLFRWVKNFLYAFLVMLAIRLLFYFSSAIPAFEKLSYVGAWWQYFSFALIFYYIAIAGYANAIKTKVPFRVSVVGYSAPLLLHFAGGENKQLEQSDIIDIEPNLAASSNDAAFMQEWKPRIEYMMQQKRAYENAELSLAGLARQLKTNPSILSKAINQSFQANFNDFINGYRVEAVKKMLVAGEQKTQTLLGIAYSCGFNSKATFNRAFKKSTGKTPKEWLQNDLQQQ